MISFSLKQKYLLSLNEIQGYDGFDEHFELFNNAVSLLEDRLKNNNFEEFSDEERELLEEVYSYING